MNMRERSKKDVREFEDDDIWARGIQCDHCSLSAASVLEAGGRFCVYADLSIYPDHICG